MSLFKVLNKTKTPGGERLLKVWIRQPLTDISKIQERLEIVQAFVDDTLFGVSCCESRLFIIVMNYNQTVRDFKRYEIVQYIKNYSRLENGFLFGHYNPNIIVFLI